MTVTLQILVRELDSLLKPGDFRDYCPNGLQVEGKADISNLVSGVTASQDFIDAAIAAKADAVLVHHGYFWQGEHPALVGIKKKRIKALLENNISLLAYHLPLDAHPSLGNNVRLGEKLGFVVEGELDPSRKSKVGVWGSLSDACSGESLVDRINKELDRAPLYIPGKSEVIRKIGWCTGSAQSFIELAYACGVDAYLTGEVSEQTVHFARETGMHFFAAGHHATERYGVQAVGNYLQQMFGVKHQFIDIDNPV